MLTSPKAFNGGHYSHPENRCILIPSELFVWLCFCFSKARAASNETREPCERDHTLHFPLKLLEVHFQSRAVFLESMCINQNQYLLYADGPRHLSDRSLCRWYPHLSAFQQVDAFKQLLLSVPFRIIPLQIGWTPVIPPLFWAGATHGPRCRQHRAEPGSDGELGNPT